MSLTKADGEEEVGFEYHPAPVSNNIPHLQYGFGFKEIRGAGAPAPSGTPYRAAVGALAQDGGDARPRHKRLGKSSAQPPRGRAAQEADQYGWPRARDEEEGPTRDSAERARGVFPGACAELTDSDTEEDGADSDSSQQWTPRSRRWACAAAVPPGTTPREAQLCDDLGVGPRPQPQGGSDSGASGTVP